jgi:hypothetical protein
MGENIPSEAEEITQGLSLIVISASLEDDPGTKCVSISTLYCVLL